MTTIASIEQRVRANEVRTLAVKLERSNEAARKFVEGALADGRIEATQVPMISRLYRRDPEAARKFVEDLRPDVLVAGRNAFSDDDRDRSYSDSASARLGIPRERLI